MKYFYSGIVSVLISIFFVHTSNAQITITPGQTATALAQMLAGPGVTISAATLNCPNNSQGIFKLVTPANIGPGMDSGIILSTGRVLTTGGNAGANGDSTLFASSDNNAPGDGVLNAYIGGTTFNACALDFDFMPLGDTVKFDYTFASEEYPNFSCSQFNDVFTFFISGPGIIGQKNIALVPGTTIPVAINSVVDTDRVNVFNTGPCTAMGAGSPFGMYYSGAKIGSTYDGFTTVLRAWEKVTPCTTYHLRLIIADVGDPSFDSGVWLRARSLSSNVSKIASSGLGVTDTPYCVRTCYPGKFTFTRQDPLPSPLVVRFLITGTAQNGIDYTKIADSVVIPANGTQATVDINALATTMPTGVKTVKLMLLSFNCDPNLPPVIVDSAVLEIYDELKVKIITPDTTICEGETVNIVAEGDDDYLYSWTPLNAGVSNTTIMNTSIKPIQTTTYTLTAKYNVCPDVKRDITITVEPIPIVDLGDDTTICQWDSVKLHAEVGPKWYTNYSYLWSPAANLNKDNDSDVVHTAFEDKQLSVIVKTGVGCTGYDTINVAIYPGNFASAPQDKGICPRDTVELVVNGATKFNWTPDAYLSNTTDSIVKSSPPGPVSYTVYVENEHGCRDTVTVPVATYPDGVIYLGEDVFLRPGERYQMDARGNCIEFTWFPNVGLSSINAPNPVASPEANTRYFVTGKTVDGCATTDTIDVYRKETELDIPNAFTPNGLNHELKIVMRGIATLKYFRIFNRWGEKVFETSDIKKGWDGRYNDQDQPMGVYIYNVEAETVDGRRFYKQGNVTLIR